MLTFQLTSTAAKTDVGGKKKKCKHSLCKKQQQETIESQRKKRIVAVHSVFAWLPKTKQARMLLSMVKEESDLSNSRYDIFDIYEGVAPSSDI